MSGQQEEYVFCPITGEGKTISYFLGINHMSQLNLKKEETPFLTSAQYSPQVRSCCFKASFLGAMVGLVDSWRRHESKFGIADADAATGAIIVDEAWVSSLAAPWANRHNLEAKPNIIPTDK